MGVARVWLRRTHGSDAATPPRVRCIRFRTRYASGSSLRGAGGVRLVEPCEGASRPRQSSGASSAAPSHGSGADSMQGDDCTAGTNCGGHAV
jgi:hypothetical protein